MFVFRSVRQDDFKQILALSKMLNQINLSTNPEELQKQIEKGVIAFSGEERNKAECEYIFCIEDTETKKIIGASMIMAQHGTKESPHYYFQVLRLEKFSTSIHAGLVHNVLRC